MRYGPATCPLVVWLCLLTANPADAWGDKEPTYKGNSLSFWLKQLKSHEAKERVQAAVALGAVEGWKPDRPKAKEVVPALVDALKDKEDEVRAAVALTRSEER